MSSLSKTTFDLHDAIHELKHYLPAQAPLKDFIHHNTLHAFQKLKFHAGIQQAAQLFGYKISLTLDEYRALYKAGKIRPEILRKVVLEQKGAVEADAWVQKLLDKPLKEFPKPIVGRLRRYWKTSYHLDLDSLVQPILFRLLCSYLDQGISMWDFPAYGTSFLASVRELERNSFSSFFRKSRARNLLRAGEASLEDLLKIVVGDNSRLYTRYLFDQQFSHQGWSGLVSTVEDFPATLLDPKKISLHDLVYLELLLEIDALDNELGRNWKPLETVVEGLDEDFLAVTPSTEQMDMLALWQDAFEWSYYDSTLAAIQYCDKSEPQRSNGKSFQAMFCIDDRECSLRRYLEKESPTCETFGTPGFFGVEFFFKPIDGKFVTKTCPAPVTPKYLIKEVGSTSKRKKDLHLSKSSHGLFRGFLISQTLGFWSVTRLAWNIFRPSMGPASSSSFLHHDKVAKLTVENIGPESIEDGLQIGYTIPEMVQRVEGLLRSIGLLANFADIVYVVGHGSSSVNNPHYAAYDCGACSGRPGSVNARVICHMANHHSVRVALAERGIHIPATTRFIGGLHDTTRDEIEFYDVEELSPKNFAAYEGHLSIFERALDSNAKERSRRLELINSKNVPEKVHQKVKLRSVSLFEPRPELNHATNAMCIVGRRSMTRHLFLDRRSFMNSYDYTTDPEGKALLGILRAAAPVCGGINLEYFFSRVDNEKLGAGSKLPHNVMGLVGVANGADGDLRPGLPSQMIEVHDPVRLLLIVEHFPDLVLKVIQSHPETYEWFINEWVHLVVYQPEEGCHYHFKDGAFHRYVPLIDHVDALNDLEHYLETQEDNLPVYQIQ
jgi:uncharacterized protein